MKYDTPAGDYELERTENKFGFLDSGEGKAGLHYAVASQVTLGGTLQYKSKSGEDKDSPPGGTTTSTDLPTETMVAAGVRVNYAFRF